MHELYFVNPIKFFILIKKGFLTWKRILVFGTRPHGSHLGINKTRHRARTIFYWPGMSSNIESLIQNCLVCEKFLRQNCKETLINHSVSTRPFSKVGIDSCSYGNRDYLVIVDYFSKWLEIVLHRSKTINSVISTLKELFSRFGIPNEIVCDNVPFNSYKFKLFAEEYDFEPIYISAKHSRSNGMAEEAVHIAKLFLKKSHEDGTNLYSMLLEYRYTPFSKKKEFN